MGRSHVYASSPILPRRSRVKPNMTEWTRSTPFGISVAPSGVRGWCISIIIIIGVLKNVVPFGHPHKTHKNTKTNPNLSAESIGFKKRKTSCAVGLGTARGNHAFVAAVSAKGSCNDVIAKAKRQWFGIALTLGNFQCPPYVILRMRC